MIINEITKITEFVIKAFTDIWPYLLITIPIAVAVNMSGASKYIKNVFNKGPYTAVILATVLGAFSPFCSCSVIPVVASLLIAKVPLAPVMSFWIASPSMDPEIFFLSVGTLGFNLAVWRLTGTLILSLSAGFITLYLEKRGWIGKTVLKENEKSEKNLFNGTISYIKGIFSDNDKNIPAYCCAESSFNNGSSSIYITDSSGYIPEIDEKDIISCCENNDGFGKKLFKESLDASLMVLKFMILAFFLEALIIFYLPEELITALIGSGNSFSIVIAAFVGIPVYTSNISALPMIKGLLTQGMSQGAALAFLIAGPTTTLPAMAAVWKLVKLRIFIFYVILSLAGAIILGYLKMIAG